MISTAHQRLRDATREDHQRLEDRVALLQRIVTPRGRRGLVEDFAGFHADAEAAVAPWLSGVPGLDFEARRRSTSLANDLVTVGGAAPPAQAIRIRGVGEALGLMYVLEGSTLGGRVIRKQVTAQGGDMAGLSFLDPYGEAVGERWRSFLAVLDDQARTAADTEAMVNGAVAGFRHAGRRLCGAPAHG